MKVLAEYVMAGPRQASIFCFGFGFLPVVGPWLSSAAVALVVLQLGFSQAIKVIPWAALPGVVWLVLGDMSYLMLLASVVAGASVLQWYRSLANGLVAVVFVSALGFLLMQVLMPGSLEQLNRMMEQALGSSSEMSELLEQMPEQEQAASGFGGLAGDNVQAPGPDNVKPDKEGLMKTFALLTHMAFAWAGALTACLVLLLGRWWQSLLYRPGAFQAEFHALRLNWNQVLLVAAGMLLATQLVGRMGLENNLLEPGQLGLALAPVFSVPILLSGIALVHGLVAIAGASVHWLGIFYMVLLFVSHLIYLPLIVTALLDVVFDFRSRFRAKRSKDTD